MLKRWMIEKILEVTEILEHKMDRIKRNKCEYAELYINMWRGGNRRGLNEGYLWRGDVWMKGTPRRG